MTTQSRTWGQQYALYLPRILLRWQSADEPAPMLETEGTFLLVDISGFTAMSEMLATKGKVGSEEVTAVLNAAFTELLDIAMLDGGDLLRFGGDALFHLYTGDDHAARACRSAVDMRDALDEFQRTKSPSPLEMSVGVATGPITGFLAGESSKELLFVGPTASEVVRLQTDAEPGEILVSKTTAEALEDDTVLGDSKHGGILLEDAPDADEYDDDADAVQAGRVDASKFIPIRLRDHLSLAFNEGEHRPATIAFVKFTGTDVVFAEQGLEAMAEHLDELVGITQRAAERYGVAFLASDVNDDGGKLILSTGVPERSSGRGERIVHALREIVGANPRLPVHIGVARGHIFAGDLGARFRRVYTVMGDSVNLAARLAAKAGPGQIFVTARALDRSADDFVTEEVEPLELKGKSKPVSPLLIGDLLHSDDAASSPSQIPLIGRDAEMAAIVGAASEVATGAGTAIEVVGRAGMGKTRVTMEAIERLGATFGQIHINCERYEQATAHHAAAQLLGAALELKERLAAEDLGVDLTAAVERLAPSAAPFLPLLADVLRATVDMTDEVEALADDFREQRLHEVVLDLLRAALPGPTVIVVEDSQWIDDASHRLFGALASELARLPWMVVALRSEDEGASLIEGSETIELGPLSEADAALLATTVAGPATPLPVAEAIAARSGGNPYFVVELARTMDSFEGGDLPETIEAAALARIDELRPNDRRLLRYASVFGETFAIDLLADALPDVAPNIDDPEVWHRLESFLDTSSLGRVRFRQMIVRDAAYAGLPFRRRAEVHLAIAEALERRARRRPERFAEAMSLHFDRAEAWEKAWGYSTMAGDRAASKMAHVEAIRLFRRGLRAAEHLDHVGDDDLLRIHEALGDANEHVGLFADAEQAFDDAIAMGPDTVIAGRLQRKKGFLYINRGEFDEAQVHLSASLETLGEDPDPDVLAARLETMVAIAGVHFRQGDYPATVDWCTRAIELADEAHEREVAHAFYMRSVAYTHLPGHSGEEDAKHALEVFEVAKDLVGQTNVLNNMGYDAYYLGNWDEAVALWTRSVETGTKSGDIVRTASSVHNLGEIFLDQGRYAEAEPRLRRALRIWEGSGFAVGVALAHANLGRLSARTGRVDDAEQQLDLARTGFADVGAAAYVLEEIIRRAEMLVMAHRSDEALELVDATVPTTKGTDGTEVSRAALERMAAYALAQLGRRAEAHERIRISEELARTADADWELAQTLEARCRITHDLDHVDEYHDLFARLGVVTRPWIRL